MLPDNEIAIQVEGLGKAYRIGLQDVKHENLVSAIKHSLLKPFRNFRRIRSLKNIQAGANGEDVFWANRNINFNINRGEVVGIIGKNGAGKSTLLKILSQITEPTEGKITLYGRVASLLEVGTGFNPELTGRENVYLNGTILGLKKIEIDKRFDSIVEFSGIQKFIDTPVKRYSSGMKVRLAFAVAAHLEPDILIIDEVLAVGDAEFQRKCIGKMQEISDGSGRTVLFVSHNMSAVKRLCTRGIVLKDGEVVFDGSQVEAINFYQAHLDNHSRIDFKDDLENAPGNEHVRIVQFLVKPLKGEIISITSGVRFQVLILNQVEHANLDLTIDLRNAEEILVFHTGFIITRNNDSKKGFYTVEIDVPAHLLNTGLYFISVIVGENAKRAIYKGRDLVSFEIIHESHGDNQKVLPGVISPALSFQSNFQEQ